MKSMFHLFQPPYMFIMHQNEVLISVDLDVSEKERGGGSSEMSIITLPCPWAWKSMNKMGGHDYFPYVISCRRMLKTWAYQVHIWFRSGVFDHEFKLLTDRQVCGSKLYIRWLRPWSLCPLICLLSWVDCSFSPEPNFVGSHWNHVQNTMEGFFFFFNYEPAEPGHLPLFYLHFSQPSLWLTLPW